MNIKLFNLLLVISCIIVFSCNICNADYNTTLLVYSAAPCSSVPTTDILTTYERNTMDKAFTHPVFNCFTNNLIKQAITRNNEDLVASITLLLDTRFSSFK